MSGEIIVREHEPKKHNDCKINNCAICDGGLFICKHCNRAEIELSHPCIRRFLKSNLRMTRTQYLLSKVAEECVEVAQRAIKAQLFGLREVQEGQDKDNARRLVDEFSDLVAVVDMLWESLPPQVPGSISAKKMKVEKFMAYSRTLGIVE